MKIFITLLISLLFLGLNSSYGGQSSSLSHPQVAIGKYKQKEQSYPLIIRSENGLNWVEVKNFSEPPELSHHWRLYDVACSTGYCTAVGKNKSQSDSPLMISSHDGGKSWQLQKFIQDLPAFIVDATLYSVSCNQKTCVSAGRAFYKTGIGPLFLISNNAGQSWTFVQNIDKYPTATMKNGVLKWVNCSEKYCVATGYYRHGGNFLISSLNQGKSWSFVKKISGIPENDVPKVAINSIHCNDHNCMLGGTYRNEPVIIKGNPEGTWSRSEVPLILMLDHGTIKSIKCFADQCFAIGFSYTKEEYGQISEYPDPIFWRTNDGESWHEVGYFSQDIPSHHRTDYESVHCTGQYCTLIGTYSKFDMKSPLLMFSDNYGKSWSFIKKINGFPETGENRKNFKVWFKSIHCSGNQCTAIGKVFYPDYYRDTVPESSLPWLDKYLLLVSHDSGQTWSSQSISNLPETTSFSDLNASSYLL